MKHKLACLAASATLFASAPAFASSDYLLTLPPEKGEVSQPMTIESWSFGACDTRCASGSTKRTISSPRDSATGMATGKRMHKPMSVTTELRESPSKSSLGKTASTSTAAGGVNVAAGDVDGDGLADLAFVTTQGEVADFTFTVDRAPPMLVKDCDDHRIGSATLSRGEDTWEISNAVITCTVDHTPARISTNLTTGKQTQGASFGERCTAGACALTDGVLIIRFAEGQMKHTKTGHVTLMK